jgi:hypothetical protein
MSSVMPHPANALLSDGRERKFPSLHRRLTLPQRREKYSSILEES